MAGELYNEVTAGHYRAYRPPLHPLILDKCLGELQFSDGLDIGCGLGHSSVALARNCCRVVGGEPSKNMLGYAIADTNVCYMLLGDEMPWENDSFDVITYAGSWFYAQSSKMAKSTFRLLKTGGYLVCYDFALDLTPVKLEFQIVDNPGEYDHSVNFDNYTGNEILGISSGNERISLPVSPPDLAHLLLAEQGWYDKLPSTDHKSLADILQKTCPPEFKADLFWSVYQKK